MTTDARAARRLTARGGIRLLAGLVVLACLLLSVAAASLYRHGLTAQAHLAVTRTREACAGISTLYADTARDDDVAYASDVAQVALQLTLQQMAGVEGGIWSAAEGFVAYAFPTHGTGEKTDTPSAEIPRIETTIRAAQDAGALASVTAGNERELIALTGCPLTATHAVWTMTRVAASGARATERWAYVLGGLAATILLLGGLCVRAMHAWASDLRNVASQIGAADLSETDPISPSGRADIDETVHAFNSARARLGDAIVRVRTLEGELRQAERAALIGELVAGIAHQIRNPLGAMRLRSENALAGDVQRRTPALEFVLTQIQRLESLLDRLLALSRPLVPTPRSIQVKEWLTDLAARHVDEAEKRSVSLEVDAAPHVAKLDPELLEEALDNLIGNAIQHAAPGGGVRISAAYDGGAESFVVADDGPGVSEALRERLFEPFASDRPGGTGLGLALARDVARSHGGDLRLVPETPGATFELRVPCPVS